MFYATRKRKRYVKQFKIAAARVVRERQNWRVLATWLHYLKVVREINRFGGAAMDGAQRRDMWAGRIERCLSADMTIKE